MVPGWFFTVPECFFYGFSRFQVSFFGSRMIFFMFFFKVSGWFFMVSDEFFWFFKVPGWFFTVPGGFYVFSRFQVGFLLFQVGFYGFSRFQVRFSWFQVGFHGFSRFQVGFSRFQVGFEGKSWLQVCFYSYRSVFIVTNRFFMVSGGFSCCLWLQVWFSLFQVDFYCH